VSLSLRIEIKGDEQIKTIKRVPLVASKPKDHLLLQLALIPLTLTRIARVKLIVLARLDPLKKAKGSVK